MLFSRYKIQGNSMEPFYKNGDRVLIWRYGKIKAGDTIVFKKNALTMIKKVEKIENSRSIKNSRYILKANNWENGSDSDDFGTIEKNEIIGKVILKY